VTVLVTYQFPISLSTAATASILTVLALGTKALIGTIIIINVSNNISVVRMNEFGYIFSFSETEKLKI
jgi:hypothetical protein